MFLTLALALAAPPETAPAPRLLGEFATLKTPTGTLHATLDLPATPGPWPAVLLHPGSGPFDRDGNGMISLADLYWTDCTKQLGRALAARGVAVLRIDKRGVGKSGPALKREDDIRVETYASDAAAWVALLRKDRRFTSVGIIGHSEGTLIGLLAAREQKVDSFVCLCGLARPLQDTLRAQLRDKLSKDLYAKADAIMKELEAGREVPAKDVPASLRLLFRPSVQPYLISEFKQDPVVSLAKLDCPVLVVSGSADLQVTLDDGKRLAAAKPSTRRLVLERMNHVLKLTDGKTLAEQDPTYREPQHPLHPRLADELAAFLKHPAGK